METQLTETQIQDAVLAGKMVFEKMGPEGDVKSMWDPAIAFEVEEARRQFERLTKEQKYKAYAVKKDGEAGEPMPTFQAAAGRVIFVPALQGG